MWSSSFSFFCCSNSAWLLGWRGYPTVERSFERKTTAFLSYHVRFFETCLGHFETDYLQPTAQRCINLITTVFRLVLCFRTTGSQDNPLANRRWADLQGHRFLQFLRLDLFLLKTTKCRRKHQGFGADLQPSLISFWVRTAIKPPGWVCDLCVTVLQSSRFLKFPLEFFVFLFLLLHFCLQAVTAFPSFPKPTQQKPFQVVYKDIQRLKSSRGTRSRSFFETMILVDFADVESKGIRFSLDPKHRIWQFETTEKCLAWAAVASCSFFCNSSVSSLFFSTSSSHYITAWVQRKGQARIEMMVRLFVLTTCHCLH